MDIERLEARVKELERRCSRLQLAGVGLLTLLAGACLSGALAPMGSTLRAERFELVNSKGEVRGRLENHGTTPRLVLVSPENDSIVGLCAGATLISAPGRGARFTLATRADGTIDPLAWLDAEQGDKETRGLATLTLGAPSGLVQLGVDVKQSWLALDGNGPVAALGVGSHEEAAQTQPFAALTLLAEDPDGQGDFGHAYLGTSRSGGAMTLGANDVEAVDIHSADGKPSLELRDMSETTVFRAP